MSLEESIAAVAVALGEADEEKINNMSYVWFQNVLEAIGKKYNFDSLSNLYGNSFFKESSEVINNANPLIKATKRHMLSGAIMDKISNMTTFETVKEEDLFKGGGIFGGLGNLMSKFDTQNKKDKKEDGK